MMNAYTSFWKDQCNNFLQNCYGNWCNYELNSNLSDMANKKLASMESVKHSVVKACSDTIDKKIEFAQKQMQRNLSYMYNAEKKPADQVHYAMDFMRDSNQVFSDMLGIKAKFDAEMLEIFAGSMQHHTPTQCEKGPAKK